MFRKPSWGGVILGELFERPVVAAAARANVRSRDKNEGWQVPLEILSVEDCRLMPVRGELITCRAHIMRE
jgi:hypothetical protein